MVGIGSCAPAAVVSEDGGAGAGGADGGELHPRRFLGQARDRLVAVVCPGDLADRAVGRVGVAHLKVDGHDGHRVVLEGELALRVVGLLPDAVFVQRLVLDGARQRAVAARAADEVVRRAEDRLQDGRRGRHVDDLAVGVVVEPLPRGGRAADAVAQLRRRAGLDGLHDGAVGRGPHLGQQLRGEAIAHGDESIPVEQLGRLLDLVWLAQLKPGDTIILHQVVAELAYVRVVVLARPARARDVVRRDADLMARRVVLVCGEIREPAPRVLVWAADLDACARLPISGLRWQHRCQRSDGSGQLAVGGVAHHSARTSRSWG